MKVYDAYKAAVEHKGQPTVILAKTVKGYGLGEAGEGRNITHQQKKLNERELRVFRSRFDIPISDEDVAEAPFYRPPDDSPETAVPPRAPRGAGRLHAGTRSVRPSRIQRSAARTVQEFARRASGDREVSTTMAFVGVLTRLLKRQGDRQARSCRSFPTKRAPSAWRRCSASSASTRQQGQLYEPVDADMLLYYKEAKDGQILEEGITEAGSMASFIAAGTAYANHGVQR